MTDVPWGMIEGEIPAVAEAREAGRAVGMGMVFLSKDGGVCVCVCVCVCVRVCVYKTRVRHNTREKHMLVQLITSTTHHTRARACTRPHKHTTHTLVHVQKRSYTRHVLEHAHKLTHKTHLAEKFELGKKIVDETAAGFDFKVCVRMCVCICEGEFCVRSGLKKVATATSVSFCFTISLCLSLTHTHTTRRCWPGVRCQLTRVSSVKLPPRPCLVFGRYVV